LSEKMLSFSWTINRHFFERTIAIATIETQGGRRTFIAIIEKLESTRNARCLRGPASEQASGSASGGRNLASLKDLTCPSFPA
jgi:hypothetical protein